MTLPMFRGNLKSYALVTDFQPHWYYQLNVVILTFLKRDESIFFSAKHRRYSYILGHQTVYNIFMYYIQLFCL